MKQYIVDAFTDTVFKGNPAAVCILDAWIPEGIMMKIAMENRFSETAFAVQEGGAYHLRWFTPGGEIDLCGHATLAAAYVIFHFYQKDAEKICFKTLGGPSLCAATGISFVWIFLAIPSCLSLSQMPWQMPSVCVQNVPIWDGTLSVSFQMKSRSGTQKSINSKPLT